MKGDNELERYALGELKWEPNVNAADRLTVSP